MSFFDIHNTLITVYGYPLSYIECVGTCFGLLCVWLGAKNNILNWPAGLVNVLCFFIIFYQVRLYSDMFLQVYFFGIGIYGWIRWGIEKNADEPVTVLSKKEKYRWVIGIAVSEIIAGFTVKNIHLMFPKAFPVPAAFPFIDSFIAVCSIAANILLAKRILENWALWVLIDFICTIVYAMKHILFISLEYGILLMIAAYGLYGWMKAYKKQQALS